MLVGGAKVVHQPKTSDKSKWLALYMEVGLELGYHLTLCVQVQYSKVLL